MAVIAGSLGIMSYLHQAGVLTDGSPPFRSSDAGIAEAVIGVVLLAGALAVWRIPDRARPAALAAIGFALVGFVVGISITAASGAAVDIAYHATVLPILAVTMVLLLRSRRLITHG
jgi:glycerol uptake facilitator-like aquaporin